jgi:aldose 1-epimerase
MKTYGITADGQQVYEFTLTNSNGMEVKVITYGAIITSIRVPDRNGVFTNVALGFENLEKYQSDHPYFGAIAGRYANRIANGKFTLDGTEYTLAQNDGTNSLHGGLKGFDKVVWTGEAVSDAENTGVKLSYHSPDGEEGYPADLDVVVIYWLTPDNEIKIEYQITAAARTIANVTNHSYFNLDGEGNGTIYDHILTINADHYTPTDERQIPTGEIAPVEGTPFDFRTAKSIASGQRSSHPQMLASKGYDHNFVLNRDGVHDSEISFVAQVYAPSSGRIMEVWTTEPGVQFYAGNFLESNLVGASGRVYRQCDGLALETQHYPDSPNQPNFPSTVLEPNQTYHSTTIYKFSTDS